MRGRKAGAQGPGADRRQRGGERGLGMVMVQLAVPRDWPLPEAAVAGRQEGPELGRRVMREQKRKMKTGDIEMMMLAWHRATNALHLIARHEGLSYEPQAGHALRSSRGVLSVTAVPV